MSGAVQIRTVRIKMRCFRCVRNCKIIPTQNDLIRNIGRYITISSHMSSFYHSKKRNLMFVKHYIYSIYVFCKNYAKIGHPLVILLNVIHDAFCVLNLYRFYYHLYFIFVIKQSYIYFISTNIMTNNTLQMLRWS